MDVESPYEGTLTEWLAAVDTILPIGGEVAKMEVGEGIEEIPAAHGAPPAETAQAQPASAPESQAARRTDMPPRTRAYAKEKGLSDEEIASIPAAGNKLMPEDIDAYLSGRAAPMVGSSYTEQPLAQKQRLLASRLVRGSQLVVPGTISVVCEWVAVENLRARIKSAGGDFQPSAFTMFAFAVARALRDFPMFRSTLVGDGTLRTYNTAHLGIAVALPGDELVLAVVDDADQLEWRDFATRMRAQIELARSGQDQANESVTISLTNMQAAGLRDAVPVVVPPGVATLFLGESYYGIDQDTAAEAKLTRLANLALTFDHRLINGVGAADFLNAVKANVESIGSLIA